MHRHGVQNSFKMLLEALVIEGDLRFVTYAVPIDFVQTHNFFGYFPEFEGIQLLESMVSCEAVQLICQQVVGCGKWSQKYR